jgi:hypothetical protein
MALSQEIVWTALPNGLSDDGRARVSALVSPRLRIDEEPSQLGAFPDFLNWPDVVNNVTFGVTVDGQGAPLPTERISAPAEPELWSNLFQATTTIRPFAFRDFANRDIRMYPVARVLSYPLEQLPISGRTAEPDVAGIRNHCHGTTVQNEGER